MVNNSTGNIQLVNDENSLYVKCGTVDFKAHLDNVII